MPGIQRGGRGESVKCEESVKNNCWDLVGNACKESIVFVLFCFFVFCFFFFHFLCRPDVCKSPNS